MHTGRHRSALSLHAGLWITSDGRNWQVSPAWDGPDDDLVLRPAWPVSGGWEALGFEWALPPGTGDRIYRSADGLHWSLSETLPGQLAGPVIVLAYGTQRVVSGTWYDDTSVETPPSVHVSTEQGEWTLVRPSEFSWALDERGASAGAAPLPGGPPVWVLGGWTGDGEAPAVLWASRDLIDWTEHSLSTGSDPGWSCGVNGLEASTLGIVAIEECSDLSSVLWFSSDGDGWEQLPPLVVAGVAAGPASVVGIGEPDDMGLVTVWRLVT